MAQNKKLSKEDLLKLWSKTNVSEALGYSPGTVRKGNEKYEHVFTTMAHLSSVLIAEHGKNKE